VLKNYNGKDLFVLGMRGSPVDLQDLDYLEAAEQQLSRGGSVLALITNNAQEEALKGKVVIDEADRLRLFRAFSVVGGALASKSVDVVDGVPDFGRDLEHIRTFNPDSKIYFWNSEVTGSQLPELPEMRVCEDLGIYVVNLANPVTD